MRGEFNALPPVSKLIIDIIIVMSYIRYIMHARNASGGKMKTLTIRGVDLELATALKEMALKKNKSVNKFLLEMLKNITGISKNNIFKTYDDLNHLAGGWTKDDELLFDKNTNDFRKIDEEMWK